VFDIGEILRDEAEKAFVDEVVKECRKEGVTSVDNVTINLDAEMRRLGVRLDHVKRQVARRIG
jgi:hypothetical protein